MMISGMAMKSALGFAAVLCLMAASGQAFAQATSDLVTRDALRVCADPRDLPFSDQQQAGFENKIADLFGKKLNLPVSYVWYPATVGFVRNTLAAHRCDIVMGTVAGGEMMDTTNAYYHTGYMIVTRSADHIDATSLADPVFAGKRLGLIAGTPPTDLVIRHHLMGHTTSYALVVDTRHEAPSHEMLVDLAAGKIDAGLLWGPFAGYYIKQDHLPLHAVFLQAEPGAPRLDYRIAMGVRPNEITWRRTLNGLISSNQTAIQAILADYGIPELDEQGHPEDPAAQQ
jgi:quinoprotein dehydrogenase-associated probable ABC transporter substrate-binding protein